MIGSAIFASLRETFPGFARRDAGGAEKSGPRLRFGPMALTQQEAPLAEMVRARREQLLADLRLHVGIPTGGVNTVGLDRTRELLTSRLRALGASVELV